MIKFASIIFPREPNQEKVCSTDIIFNEKKDKEPIQPRFLTDFEESKLYYVWWSACGKKNCTPKDKCCTFYKGLIKSLGG